MPTLPTYKSTEQLQTVQQPNIGRQYGIADVVGAVGQKMTEQKEQQQKQFAFQQKISAIESSNQVKAAKIQNTNANNLLLEDAELNPDKYKEDGIFEEQQKKTQQALADEIPDPIYRQQFLLESSGTMITTGIKARASIRKKAIDTADSLRVDEYLLNRDALGDRVGNIYNIAGEALSSGMLPNKDKANEEAWENIVGLSVYDAEKSPEDAKRVLNSLLANDGTYPIEGDYMETAIKEVESIHKRTKKRADLNKTISGNVAQTELQAIVNDDKLSYEERYRSIASHEGLTNTQKETFHKLLRSNMDIDPKTNAVLLMKYGKRLTDLRNRFGFTPQSNLEPEDAGAFLTNTQELRDEIINSYAEGELSYENYLSLSGDVDRYSGAKSQEALKNFETDWEVWSGYDNEEAVDYFQEFATDIIDPPKMFQNYYTTLKRLQSDKDAQKQWNTRYPDSEWSDSANNRETLAHDVLKEYEARDRQTAIQLMTKYSGIGEIYDEELLQKAMTETGASKESLTKRLSVGNFGLRHDKSGYKGLGFLGDLRDSKGIHMTEFSLGTEIDGKEMEIPSIVPTLTKSEIKTIVDDKTTTDAINKKAFRYAEKRIAEGKSVWASDADRKKEIIKRTKSSDGEIRDIMKRDNRTEEEVLDALMKSYLKEK